MRFYVYQQKLQIIRNTSQSYKKDRAYSSVTTGILSISFRPIPGFVTYDARKDEQ